MSKVLIVSESIEYKTFFQDFPDMVVDVNQVISAEEALNHLEWGVPDLFIIEANLKPIDGLALCADLRSHALTKNTEIILLMPESASAQALRDGYIAGADACIPKPLDASFVSHFVTRVTMRAKESLALQNQLKMANETAMTAIVSMGELGVVLMFLRRASHCMSYHDLGLLVLHTLESFGLEGVLELRGEHSCLRLGLQGDLTEDEDRVLSHASSLGRIFEMRTRCVFNYDKCSLLILNMPANDVEKHGRLRDHLAQLCEGIDARVVALDASLNLGAQNTVRMEAISRLHDAVVCVKDTLHDLRVQNLDIIDSLLLRVEQNFVSLGLTDLQESNLLRQVQLAKNEAHALFSKEVELESKLVDLVRHLEGNK